MKNKILTLFLMIFLIGFVSSLDSLGTFKQDNDVRITQVCSNATYITLSSITFPNSTIAIEGINMTSAGNGEYYYNFTNTSDVGRYYVRGISDGCEETFVTYFYINNKGQETTYSYLIATVVLILTFLFIGFLIYKDKENMNDETYWNKIVSKWQNKNYIRFSALIIWYNLKKNSYILQYLIGLVIIIMIYDITLVYNLDTISSVFSILLVLYTWGSLLVIMVLFGSIQEWIMQWKEELEKINWGGFGDGK